MLPLLYKHALDCLAYLCHGPRAQGHFCSLSAVLSPGESNFHPRNRGILVLTALVHIV